MSKGWIKLHREIADDEMWTCEPFSKSQAWIDLILLANHKQGIIDVRGNMVVVERGQVGWSQVKLAKRWRWSRNKLRRYLKWLESVQKIAQHTEQVTSIISILNYEEYQKNDTADDTTKRQQTIQQKDNKRNTNKNDKNDKNDKNKTNTYKSELQNFVEHFNELFKRQFTVTDGKVKKWIDRRKNFSVDQLTKAVENLSQSPFHRGVNDRGWSADPDFLLRNDEQVDKWINYQPEEAKQLAQITRRSDAKAIRLDVK
jgi:hypothetical protein